jgi:uncharacterized protein (DUF1778 family)
MARVTETERLAIGEAAAEAGVTVSAFVWLAALSFTVACPSGCTRSS